MTDTGALAAHSRRDHYPMTTVTPNPYSPYADADHRFRHIFPSLFGAPLPGRLAPTGCSRLAVVPPETAAVSITTQTLPDGLCEACVADMRFQELPADCRPLGACRGCTATTDHDGLCAMCRIDAHAAWWATQNTTQGVSA